MRGGWAEAAQAGHLFDASVMGCAILGDRMHARPWGHTFRATVLHLGHAQHQVGAAAKVPVYVAISIT